MRFCGAGFSTLKVRLAFVLTPVLQEVDAEAELRSLRNDAAGPAADDATQYLSGDRADLELLPLGRLRRPVTKNHVAQFVRHHAGDFPIRFRRFDHAAMKKHRPAWKGERVDILQIDDVEAVAEFRLAQVVRNLGDQAFTDTFDEVLGATIVDHRQLLTHFRCRLLSELDVLLW